jgi:ribosomal protein S18 acetylase RimI-like enzyme
MVGGNLGKLGSIETEQSMPSASHLPLKIRPCTSDDLDPILEVQASALRTSSKSYSSLQIESLVRSQGLARLDPNEIGLVAEHEHKVIGFVVLIFPSFLTQNPKISGIYIHPNFMRQGIGRQLLESVERLVIEKGYDSIDVTSSLVAVSFYEQSGYHFVRESGFYSEAKIWVPCQEFKKQLIFLTATERWQRRATLSVSMLESFFLSIRSNFFLAFIAGLLLFKAIAVLANFWG